MCVWMLLSSQSIVVVSLCSPIHLSLELVSDCKEMFFSMYGAFIFLEKMFVLL